MTLAPASTEAPLSPRPPCPGLLIPEQPCGSLTLPLPLSGSLRLTPEQFAELCQANAEVVALIPYASSRPASGSGHRLLGRLPYDPAQAPGPGESSC